jgi:hypothetical protein
MTPTPPPYDPEEWQKAPWDQKMKMACQAWALQGYGTPTAVYLIYLLKIAGYLALWCFFCSFTTGLGDPRALDTWCFETIAFQKALLWTMAFEGLGLGCSSGPLSARYWPPFGGLLYFLRPGTIKMPFIPGIPIFGGPKRTYLDAALYLAHYLCLFRVLIAPEITPDMLIPMIVILPILGLSDKTIVLSSRAEHYYCAMVCFLFPDWIEGIMAVQLAIWLWAAFSKLNQHFPTVVGVMTSNSPTMPFQFVRKLMYRNFPEDLRASKLAHFLAHLGAVFEFGFPIVLMFSHGGPVTVVTLIVMVGFHAYITSNFPMAVPIEWNIVVVYSGLFLFGHHADMSVFNLHSPILIAFLVVPLLVLPLLGNFVPSKVSFLFSMRYYAGNWPFSVWLFKKEGDVHKKIDQHIKKSSPWVVDQLLMFYDQDTIDALLGKIPAFRAMHLQGRALQIVLPKAVDNMEDYQYVDGELVAGMVIGWNFGDGHLHDEQLLRTVQNECQFEEGELRCAFFESQPFLGSTMEWRISDAKTGPIDKGTVTIKELTELQPWPVESSSTEENQGV